MRIYGVRPEDMRQLRGTELKALALDVRERLQMEQLEAETLVTLKQWLEAQGG